MPDRLHAFEQALIFALQQQGFGERQCDAGLLDLQPPGAQQLGSASAPLPSRRGQHAEQPPGPACNQARPQRVLQFDDRSAELALRAQLFGLVQFLSQVGCGVALCRRSSSATATAASGCSTSCKSLIGKPMNPTAAGRPQALPATR